MTAYDESPRASHPMPSAAPRRSAKFGTLRLMPNFRIGWPAGSDPLNIREKYRTRYPKAEIE